MAQRTLIELTQMILQSMGRTQVDSIEETDDSLQVAQIIREVYYEGLANRNWAHKYQMTTISPLGLDTPTHFILPTDLKDIDWIKYNKQRFGETRRRYETIEYKDPVDFLDMTNSRSTDKDDVDIVMDPKGIELLLKNDKQPEYWTSFDQTTAVFDSYDSEVESTLQESKMQVWAVKTSEFTLDNAFVPDIPEVAFPWLLAEAKSVASIEINQEGNQKAEQQSRRQQQWLSRNNRKVGTGKVLAQFGRSRRK